MIHKSLSIQIVTKHNYFHFLLIPNTCPLSFKRCEVDCATGLLTLYRGFTIASNLYQELADKADARQNDPPALCPDFAKAFEHGETAGANPPKRLGKDGRKRGETRGKHGRKPTERLQTQSQDRPGLDIRTDRSRY